MPDSVITDATSTQNRSIDSELIEIIDESPDPADDILDRLGTDRTNRVAKRVVDLAITKLREMRNADYRASVKPVSLPAYDRASLENIVAQSTAARERTARAPIRGVASVAASVQSSQRVMREARLALSILDEWKIGSKSLRHATKADIMEAMSQDKASAAGLLQNVDFYGRLAEALPRDDATVGDHLSVGQVNEMREIAYVG